MDEQAYGRCGSCGVNMSSEHHPGCPLKIDNPSPDYVAGWTKGRVAFAVAVERERAQSQLMVEKIIDAVGTTLEAVESIDRERIVQAMLDRWTI